MDTTIVAGPSRVTNSATGDRSDAEEDASETESALQTPPPPSVRDHVSVTVTEAAVLEDAWIYIKDFFRLAEIRDKGFKT
jgi:hypothetical protein